MAAYPLTADELELIDSVENATPHVFPKPSPGHIPARIIRAETLRRILMGLDVDRPGQSARPVRLTSLGVNVQNAAITGPVELHDVCGPNGEALPPLVLRDCYIPETVFVVRARFRHLSFEGSRISHICGIDLKVEGALDLSDLTSAEQGTLTGVTGLGVCWVDMTGAVIDGKVKASRSRFVARTEDRSTQEASKEPRFALNLRQTLINDGVDLYPGVEAVGGINFYRAEIDGDVEAYGARLTGYNCWLPVAQRDQIMRVGRALNCVAATIKGRLLLNPYSIRGEDSQVFSTVGDVALNSVNISGSVSADGIRIDGSLTAQQASVGGDINLGMHVGQEDGQSHLFVPHISRNADFSNLACGGDFFLRGAIVGRHCSLLNATLARSLYAEAWYQAGERADVLSFCVGDMFNISGATVSGNILAFGARFKGDVRAGRLTVKGDVIFSSWSFEDRKLTAVTHFEKRLNLNDARISGDIYMSGAQLQGGMEAWGLHARRVHFTATSGFEAEKRKIYSFFAGSDVVLNSATISGLLEASGARISGNFQGRALTVGEVQFGPRSGIDGDDRKTVLFEVADSVNFYGATVSGDVFLTGAQIKGDLNFRSATLQRGATLRGYTLDEEKITFPLRIDGSLIFYDATLSGDLNADGSRIGRSVDIDNCRISNEVFFGSFIGFADGKEQNFPFTVGGDISAVDGSVKFNFRCAGAHLGEGLNARRLRVEANLDLSKLTVGGDVDLANATVLGRLTMSLKKVSGKKSGAATEPINWSLRNARVHELEDTDGAGVRDLARLNLDGFEYDSLSTSRLPAQGAAAQLGDFVSRVKRWLQDSLSEPLLGYSSIVGFIAAIFVLTQKGHTPHLAAMLAGGVAACMAIQYLVFSGRNAATSDAREKWLRLQFETWPLRKVHRDQYSPGPYEKLAAYFHREGLYEDAQLITRTQLVLERKLNSNWFLAPFWKMYEIGFDYGLSPRNAILTFSACLLIGVGGTYVADHGFDLVVPRIDLAQWRIDLEPARINPVLMVTTNTVNTQKTTGDNGKPEAGLNMAAPDTTYTGEIPCGSDIDPVIYTLDIFLPVVDLQQKSQCNISTAADALPWRIARAVFTLLGWLVTSLTVLTVSGILRRHNEA